MKNALRSGGKWNRLKNLWRDDRTALGVLATIPSVQTVQLMAQTGVDFILIDMEHGPIDANTAHTMIAATQGTSVVPLVRVGATEPWLAKVPLDIGALGVCFPMTNTRTDAEAVVNAVHYPPRGERFWGPFYAAPRWGASLSEYTQQADDEVLAIGMIEHIDAVAAAPDIVSTPGLDLVFVGPGDLATSMGHQAQVDHPDVIEAINRVEGPILDSDVILGGVATSPEKANQMIDRGYRALIVGFDWMLLQRGLASALEGVRR
jgi:4-hydroxy-2-oxoheptanedioate aldolase